MGAVLGAAAIGLALAFAAIAAGLLVRTFVSGPIRSASYDLADTPVIGGALSWLLWHTADWIELQLDAFAWIYTKGVQDGSYWLWTIVTLIVNNAFGWAWSWIGWANGAINWLNATVWNAVFGDIPELYRRVDNAAAVAASAWGLVSALWYDRVPALERFASDIASTANAALAMAQEIALSVIPLLWQELERQAGRIGNAERSLSDLQSVTLPRIQADVNQRALESEAEALRKAVASLQVQVAFLSALGVLAIAGTEAIQNLRCIQDISCDPLAALATNDVLARLDELEIGNS